MANEPPGIAFQNLVALLERILSSSPGVSIESPSRLHDKDTGRMREHDVVITRVLGHHRILTAIECKDRGRKVGVPDVEAFAKKCEKTGIHHPVLVSSNGFTETARKKGEALDVDLMSLAEVERFDWMAADFVVGWHRCFDEVDVRLECFTGPPTGATKAYSPEGDEISVTAFKNLLESNLQEPDDMSLLLGIKSPVEMRFVTPGLTAIGDDGVSHAVAAVTIASSYVVERREHIVRSHQYSGEHGGYSIVSTDLTLDGHEGKLVFLRDGDGVQVVWQRIDSEQAS